MIRRGAVLLVLLVVCGLGASSFAVAQPTISGFSLNASVRSDGKVQLNWSKPAGDSVRYYLVYRTSLTTILGFTRIDSTTRNEYIDSPPATNVVPPMYVYYVEARMNSGFAMKSNLVTVMLSIPRVDVVRILSEPVKTGKVGVLYTYRVKAVSSDSTAKLKYDLSYRPTGMTVDTTGLIKWTPDRKGTSTVQVTVYSSKGGKASQLFYISVTGPSGVVAGTVSDTSGKPIAKVTVRLYGRDRDNHFEYSAVTDNQGKYSISKIDFGTYSARAVPLKGNYLEQWYDGATTADKAKPIEVKDTLVVPVNFKLRSKATIPIFTVSGAVLDSAKKPVKGAWVSFAVSSFGFNSSRPGDNDWSGDDDNRDLFDQGQMRSFGLGVVGAMPGVGTPILGMDPTESFDFRLDGNSIYVYTTRVDSLGKYSLKLPQGSYIVQAYASGYYRLFYNNRSDFLSADIIKVLADAPNINFALKPVHPLALGKISGSVVDSTSRGGVISRVLAYRLRPVGRDTIIAPKAYMADTDSLGAYSLANLPPGDYIVLAVPLGHYVPSFYSVLGSTNRWKDATRISVDGNSVAGITIYVVPMLRTSTGYASIRGNVTSSTPTSFGSMGKLSAAAGIEGSMVYAVDNASGQVAGYGVTNTDGSFTIAELAPGSYSVTVDKVEYSATSATATPTYDAVTGAADASTVSLNIDAVVTDVAQEPGVIPESYVLEQNYPNPFNPSTQILFSMPKSERISLVVYNLLGQKVATLVEGLLEQGTHAVTWNGRDAHGFQLSSGVYFYTLKTASFVASRRMVLLK
ncbi:MAG: carboxypeptidase regulatory-like domain-containing protein [Ignavibacteriales bacterium]|nr:carboxypeptidase regulatory-like domain-containing protein [Ignavibacteriales bacterium]